MTEEGFLVSSVGSFSFTMGFRNGIVFYELWVVSWARNSLVKLMDGDLCNENF